jgi:CHAD domain-containing protein
MAYRFKKSEAISHAIQRVFAEEISWAVGQLVHSKNRATAVHEARKSIKKIRGLSSLVKGQLGPLYKREDRYFRDAGRLLSNLRDNDVMLQVFDVVAAKHPEMDPDRLAEIRSNLLRRQRETSDEKQVSAQVEDSLRQVKPWPIGDLRFELLLTALTDSYRAGRKAFKRVQKSDTAENLHALRKKVKQHWYHLRLFESTNDAAIKKRLPDLHHLETWLGDDHNLSVLRECLAADAETDHDRRQVRQFIDWIDEESAGLRKRALELSERLYAEKPAAFSKHLAFLWTPPRKAPATSALRANSAVA